MLLATVSSAEATASGRPKEREPVMAREESEGRVRVMESACVCEKEITPHGVHLQRI
ncbi:hypothetical protein GCM10027567_08560 [Spongiibacter taiwanensis]